MSLSYILELNEELRRKIRENLLLGKTVDIDEAMDYLDEAYKMLGLADRSKYMRSVAEEEAPAIIKVKLLLSGLSEDIADYLERESRKKA